MIGHPKPSQMRAAKKAARLAALVPKKMKRIKASNAYTRPAWRKLVAQVRRRSGGICEARVKCNGAPVEGDPHRKSYADFKGWKRLIVPLDQLLDCCHGCHKSFHR